jgi:hypothetical protein
VKPSELRNVMQNFRVIEVSATPDGPAVDIVVDGLLLASVEAFEQGNGHVGILGNGWSLYCGAIAEITNVTAYDMMNTPGHYVRLPHPNRKLNTFVIAYAPITVPAEPEYV